MGQHMHLGVFPTNQLSVKPNFFGFDRHVSS
jgi:hypothetical protein